MDLNKITKEELIKKLKDSHLKEKFFENISNVAYFITDNDRIITSWNQTCETFYGYKKEQALGEKIEDLILPDFQKDTFIQEFKERHSIFGEEIEYQKADGIAVRAFVNSLFLNTNNDKYQYHHISIDPLIIKQSNSLKNLISQNTTDLTKESELVIISFNKNGYINDFNPFAEKLLGYKKDDVIARNFIELFVPTSYQEKTLNQIQESFKSKNIHMKSDLPILCKNGTKKIIHWNQTFVYDYKTKKHHMLLIGDNKQTDRNAQDRLEYLANYDALTDLPNQNLLHNRMVNAINKSARYDQKMITMYINLDNFKSINHTMGYAIGDELLKAVAERLHSELRDSDTVARFSGDEFVILFENIQDELDAGAMAKRVHKLFSKPFIFKENEIFLDVNIGISFFPADANDAKSLLKLANMAMLRSKEDKSRNFHFFRAEMFDEITNRAVLESNLRRALKNEEFFVEYQPQIDTKSGKIIGAEALVRWTGADLKSIPPLDFIPVAENTGLILEIGEIVLKSAISQMKKWHDKGYDDLKIAINISGIQLLQSNLINQIDEILEKEQLNPEFLELELTESVLMENIKRASELLKEFQKKGINISIDDFGTGYSSLNYLKRLPINTLKIDQSFIRNIEHDKSDKVIVNTIIAMAHALEFSVIAEGVEDKYQKDYLKEMNCDMLQGYYFGKPLSAKSFEKLLEKNDCLADIDKNLQEYDFELITELEKYSKPLNI